MRKTWRWLGLVVWLAAGIEACGSSGTDGDADDGGLVFKEGRGQDGAGEATPETSPPDLLPDDLGTEEIAPRDLAPDPGAPETAEELPKPTCPMLLLLTDSLPPSGIGEPYFAKLAAQGGQGPLTFGVDGALAPGLGVTPDGYFQGVPTQAGEFEITFNVHDQCDPPQWVKKKLSFLVVGAAPETLTWVEETPLPNDLAGAAAGYLGVAPCVAGGDTGVGKQTNAFLCYDKDDKSWNELEPMLQGRAWPGFATVGLTLYVFGGFYLGPGYLDHCEYYNTAEPGWKVCSPMPTARSGLKAAEIGGKIYAVGGYDGTKGLTTAERYDPLTDSWSMLPAMPTPRTAPAVASAEGRLYVFGGMSKVTDEYINVLEVFDPAENSWQKAPAMPVAKGAAAAIYAPPFNAILIVGGQGYDGPGQIMASNKVERYDVTTATWSIYEGGMPGYRGDLMGLWSLAGGPQHIMAIGGEANLDKQNSFYVGYFDL